MRSRGPRGERGATLIEIAFVLPMLFLLILSIVDFGIFFYVQHTVQFATREG
ncbi:MAG: TadE/TadG family type IV pilus assembly protein, partial [bacterium]